MTTTRTDPRVGTELGPYRIESVIGRGGMGVVYLATHAGLDRRVALKLLTPDYADDEAFRARFLRESKLAASIDHPNIIPIYDAGEIAGTYFLAMRYVQGTDLETRLRTGLLAPRETVHLIAQVASALDAAADAGLVHRDVKPANVLIASGKSVDRADHAYLTDFGLTKHRGSQTGLTRAGAFMGTLEYIAPEQIEGKTVDGRADQYALAAIAVACLTGQPPFPRESDIAIINAHLRDDAPSVHLRRPELPPTVDPVIARGLAKKAEDRYPDCKAFVDDLRSSLGVTATHEQQRPIPVDRRTIPVVIAGSIAALAILAAGVFWLRSGSLSPTASPSTSVSNVSPASPSPTTSPTQGAYPNESEAALVAALPIELRQGCSRGSYGEFATTSQSATPIVSVTCQVPPAQGASEVAVRRFEVSRSLSVSDETLEPRQIIDYIAGIHQVPDGDCGTSSIALDSWQLAGEHQGSVLCYVDSQTGDSILYWSYDDVAVLVRAANQKGDSADLHAFFERTARFISP